MDESIQYVPPRDTTGKNVGAPDPIRLAGDSCVGSYMREIIVYIFELVDELSVDWEDIQRNFPEENENSGNKERASVPFNPNNPNRGNPPPLGPAAWRQRFWTNYGRRLKRETLLFKDLMSQIHRCCRYLQFMHRVGMAGNPQRNMQHRCHYLLSITLSTLIDLRVFTSKHSFTVDEQKARQVLHNYGSYQTDSYMAGVGSQSKHRSKFVGPMFAYAPSLFAHDRFPNLRVLVPVELTKLMNIMFPGNVPQSPRNLRSALVRFALYLTIGISAPLFIPLTEHSWMHPRKTLGWGQIQRDNNGQEVEEEFTAAKLLAHPNQHNVWGIHDDPDRNFFRKDQWFIDHFTMGRVLYEEDFVEHIPSRDGWMEFLTREFMHDHDRNLFIQSGHFMRVLFA